MKKIILAWTAPWVVALFIALAFPILNGCAAIVSKLPQVISVVTDGMMVVDTIEAFVRNFFEKHPNPETKTKVDIAIARTRSALHAALRTAHGAEKLDQVKIDEAFDEFKKAYQELLVLTSPLGVVSSDKLAIGPSTLSVPEPLAFQPTAARDQGSGR